jgi:hypothetical protein
MSIYRPQGGQAIKHTGTLIRSVTLINRNDKFDYEGAVKARFNANDIFIHASHKRSEWYVSIDFGNEAAASNLSYVKHFREEITLHVKKVNENHPLPTKLWNQRRTCANVPDGEKWNNIVANKNLGQKR